MKKIKDKINVFLLGGLMLSLTITGAVLPDSGYSVSERRKLQDFPAISVKNILSGKFMEDFEEYTADQFPARDFFRKIKASFDKNILGKDDVNGLYEYDGYLAETDYPIDYDSIKNAAEKFTAVYEKFLTGSEGRIYLSIIPDKNYFLADISGHLKYDYDELVNTLTGKMPFAEYIDIFPLLSTEDYYFTDTHWKQENIIDVAKAIADGMGVSITDEYTISACDTDIPFYGVYASRYALNKRYDNVSRVTNDIIASLEVYDHENMKDIPVYDTAKLTSDDPYEMFLGGPVSLITIKNPSVQNGKHLTVFRDSFFSSLAPIISQAYEEVTVIDIRYISPNVLSQFVDSDGGDVLIMYSSSVINNSETLK